MRPFSFLLPALLLACTAFSAGAAEPALPDWDRLTPAQRETLIAPLRERWNAHPETRANMLERAHRWQKMTPEQRRNARHGADRWQKMSPEQRKRAREAFHRSRQMTPEERKALRARLQAMTPEQREAWRRAQHAPKANPPGSSAP